LSLQGQTPPEIPWGPVLTGIGIVASLVWNFINTRLAQSIKRQDRRFEEFKRIRTRLDNAVDQLRSTITSLRSLSITASNKATFVKDLKKLNFDLAENDSKVRTVLREMSQSRYVHGSDWETVLSPHWDNALGSLNGGYSIVKSLAEQKASIADCGAHLEALIAAIDRRVDAEMARYASDAA
jgi:hypothetical protein